MTAVPLAPLAAVRDRLLAGREPVAAVTLPLAEAVGLAAAEAVTCSAALPPRALALRPGVAVASSELVGATPHSPVFLFAAPPRVLPGDPLPPGADAVLPADAVTSAGLFHEAGQSAYPGENVRAAGGDLAAGAGLLAPGTTVTRHHALALAAAGESAIAVRRPAIRIEGAAVPEAAWLAGLVQQAGAVVADAAPDLVLALAADVAAAAGPGATLGFALQPGRDGALDMAGAVPRLVLVPRVDALLAAWCGLVLPFIAAATGRRLRHVARPLAAKITSQVGLAELALLAEGPEGYQPLATGQVTLAALLAADAWALIDPASEGAPAGGLLDATPLREPFEPR